jgi:hypothetical protein
MTANSLAALYSVLIPGLGQICQRRWKIGLLSFLITCLLLAASMALGRVSGRAAEVLFFMVLALPWWAFQVYDAHLGPLTPSPLSPPPGGGRGAGEEVAPHDGDQSFRRTWRAVRDRGHDIRFLGLLLLISALNDTWIILNNLDYLLPFYCTKPDGVPGFAAKAISPALHLVVGYGFVRLRRWALLVYLVYAAYGFTNGLVNLTCFGPGRIRNTLLAAIVISTIYIVRRRHVLLAKK